MNGHAEILGGNRRQHNIRSVEIQASTLFVAEIADLRGDQFPHADAAPILPRQKIMRLRKTAQPLDE